MAHSDTTLEIDSHDATVRYGRHGEPHVAKLLGLLVPCRVPLFALAAVIASACALTEPFEDPFVGCYDAACSDAPVLVAGVPALASLSARSGHVCGLTTTGEAWCWGGNGYGQLGDGSDMPRSAPVKVAGGLQFSSIAVGRYVTCALALDGTAYCWGADPWLGQPGLDQCGVAPSGARCSKVPLKLAGRTYTAIAVGMRHACGLDSGGAAYCWGWNMAGETGSTNFQAYVSTPEKVPGSTAFTSIAAGESFTCARTNSGRAFCWGLADNGLIGSRGSLCFTTVIQTHCSTTPVAVSNENFTELSVGISHTCGLTASGQTWCWGDNGQGQLGRAGFFDQVTPVVAQNGMSFSTIGAGGGITCGTPRGGGGSVCWGTNARGQLGVGTRIDHSSTPMAIVGDRRYTAFVGGYLRICALTVDGAAYCWGEGQGQLGMGARVP